MKHAAVVAVDSEIRGAVSKFELRDDALSAVANGLRSGPVVARLVTYGPTRTLHRDGIHRSVQRFLALYAVVVAGRVRPVADIGLGDRAHARDASPLAFSE